MYRYTAHMLKYPALQGTRIHTLMLDTTYSGQKWKFPAQSEAISIATELVLKTRQQTPGVRLAT
jgi:hypothetical protein